MQKSLRSLFLIFNLRKEGVSMKKKLIIALSAIAIAFTVTGCKDPQNVSESTTGYTKDSLLEAVKLSSITNETIEDGNVVKHTYANGAVATIRDGKVLITLDGTEFEYNVSEYADTLVDKELMTNTPETETTTAEKIQPSENPKETTITTETTTATQTEKGDDISTQEGTWVQFDDGTMKYYRPEETFTYVDGNGNEYKFNYDEWIEFQKTGKI